MTQARSKRAKNANTPENKSKYYLTNDKLLPAVIRAKTAGKFTDELAEMLTLLTRKYANRPCFNGYSFKDDMMSEAMVNLCQNALKFDAEKYNNAFSYYTSCINNSFLQFLGTEKKHRRIRDQLLIDVGENPSYNFSEEHKNNQGEDVGAELNDLKVQMEEAKVRMAKDELDRIAAENRAKANAANAAALGAKVEIQLEIEKIEFSEFAESIDTDESIPNSLLEFETTDEEKSAESL